MRAANRRLIQTKARQKDTHTRNAGKGGEPPDWETFSVFSAPLIEQLRTPSITLCVCSFGVTSLVSSSSELRNLTTVASATQEVDRFAQSLIPMLCIETEMVGGRRNPVSEGAVVFLTCFWSECRKLGTRNWTLKLTTQLHQVHPQTTNQRLGADTQHQHPLVAPIRTELQFE